MTWWSAVFGADEPPSADARAASALASARLPPGPVLQRTAVRMMRAALECAAAAPDGARDAVCDAAGAALCHELEEAHDLPAWAVADARNAGTASAIGSLAARLAGVHPDRDGCTTEMLARALVQARDPTRLARDLVQTLEKTGAAGRNAWRLASAADPAFLGSKTLEGILRLGVFHRLTDTTRERPRFAEKTTGEKHEA